MGIRRFIAKLNVWLAIKCFSFRKFFFGFDNANVFLQRVDSKAIIPILKKNGATIGEGCKFKSPLIIDNPRASYKNIKLGRGISIGANTYMDLMDEIIIKDYTGVGPGVSFLTHWHVGDVPLKQLFPFKTDKIIIDENCFIGLDCTILYGTRLKEFTLISARSIVTDTFPVGSMAGGNPAKVVNTLRPRAIEKLKAKHKELSGNL